MNINKDLLMYFLAAGGQDVSAGRPFGQELGGAVKGHLQAQSYAKLLQQLIGGGGKVTMDAENVNIKAPASAFSQGPGGAGTEEAAKQMTSANAPEGTTSAPSTGSAGISGANLPLLMSMFNPTASPLGDLASAGLVGLTPQDISQAVQFKFAQEESGQKKITDLADIIYKNALTEQALASAEASRRPEGLDQTYPVEVPGVGKVTLRQWNALDKDEKTYAMYVQTAKEMGDSNIMSPREFKLLEPTERERFLTAGLERPEIMEAEKMLRSAGATRISVGEKVETAAQLEELKGEKYFSSPKGLSADIEGLINTKAFSDQMFLLAQDDPAAANDYYNSTVFEYIENKITSKGGEIVDYTQKGNTVIWTVKWPSGRTSEVRHAFK